MTAQPFISTFLLKVDRFVNYITKPIETNRFLGIVDGILPIESKSGGKRKKLKKNLTTINQTLSH